VYCRGAGHRACVVYWRVHCDDAYSIIKSINHVNHVKINPPVEIDVHAAACPAVCDADDDAHTRRCIYLCAERQSDAMSSVVLRVYDLRYVRRTTDDG